MHEQLSNNLLFFFSLPSPLALPQTKEAKASPYDKFEGLSVNENDFF